MASFKNFLLKNSAFRGTVIVLVLLVAGWLSARMLFSRTVDVVAPFHGPAVQAVYATGTVEASVMMPISSRVAAKLLELNVDEGDQVTKGQVLGQLEDDDLRHTLDEARAREDLAAQDYKRQTDLKAKGIVSGQAVDQAKSNWEAAKANTAKAEAQLEFMKLVAPADGLILKRDGEVGQLIPAQQPVFWLSCCAPLRITAEVDEEDISLVKEGQKVLIRADAFPEQTFEGQVQSITPKGDPVSRSYRVRVSLSEETPFFIGMTTETNILVSEKQDALLIPLTAVQDGFVWRATGGTLTKVPVTLGIKGPDFAEVVEGLSSDDVIVAKPTNILKTGQWVWTYRTSIKPSSSSSSQKGRRGS